MQKFTGSWGSRLNIMFMCAMAVGVLYFAFFPANHRADASLWLARLVFLCLGGGFGLYVLYGLAESFTVYALDAEGITRRAWNGTRTLLWSHLDRFEATGQRDTTLVLKDNQGKKLPVYLSMFDKNTLTTFRSVIEPRLAPIRERQKREVGDMNRSYHPLRSVAAPAGLMFVIMTLGIGSMFLGMQPIPRGQEGAFVVLMLMLGATELGLLAILLYAWTLTITVSGFGVTAKSLFRTKQIAFHEVTSVMSRMVSDKSGTSEVTTITGNGQSIAITSRMDDYPLLWEYIRKHSGEAALSAGEAQAKVVEQTNLKQMRIVLPIFALLVFFILGGVGLMNLRDGRESIARQDLIDAKGRLVTGQIVGKEIKSRKNGHYLLYYTFDAEGQHIQSGSPVSWGDYLQANIESPIRVIYVPGQPHICRAAASIGRRRADGDIRVGYLCIGAAFVLPLFVFLPFLKSKKKPAQA